MLITSEDACKLSLITELQIAENQPKQSVTEIQLKAYLIEIKTDLYKANFILLYENIIASKTLPEHSESVLLVMQFWEFCSCHTA